MKVHVDFSVFISSPSESEAYGNVHGIVELPAVPSSGDEILFMEPPKKKLFPKIKEAVWGLAIDKVMFPVGKELIRLLLPRCCCKNKIGS